MTLKYNRGEIGHFLVTIKTDNDDTHVVKLGGITKGYLRQMWSDLLKTLCGRYRGGAHCVPGVVRVRDLRVSRELEQTIGKKGKKERNTCILIEHAVVLGPLLDIPFSFQYLKWRARLGDHKCVPPKRSMRPDRHSEWILKAYILFQIPLKYFSRPENKPLRILTRVYQREEIDSCQ